MKISNHSDQNTPSYDPLVERFLEAISPFHDRIQAIYLFGSRSRGDFRPDSDYDLLIVVQERTRDLLNALYDAVLDILLETGRLVSLKIMKKDEFTRCASLPTPFVQNVLREGIQIG